MRRPVFLQIDDNWALTADDLQWILNPSRKTETGVVWRPVAFIASDKLILAQILAGKGLADPDGRNGALTKFLAAQPLCSREWKSFIRGEAA